MRWYYYTVRHFRLFTRPQYLTVVYLQAHFLLFLMTPMGLSTHTARKISLITHRFVMETSNDFLNLMVTHVDYIIFGIHAVTVVVECNLTGLTAYISGFQIMKDSTTWKRKKKFSMLGSIECKLKI